MGNAATSRQGIKLASIGKPMECINFKTEFMLTWEIPLEQEGCSKRALVFQWATRSLHTQIKVAKGAFELHCKAKKVWER